MLKLNNNNKLTMNTLPKDLEDIVLDYKKQMELKLWKIEMNENNDDVPNWDIYTEFVISAYNEIHARELAANSCGDEGENVWLENNRSDIELIAETTTITEAKIVIGSFNAG